MINTIKSVFSIKDLENLTGIKAHTIRIWEKRYNLLSPERSDTNIRNYSLYSFQKLLNVSFLNLHGVKISKIATLSDEEIISNVKEIALNSAIDDFAINTFKIAMLNFDQALFDVTYNQIAKAEDFESVFFKVFLPLLNDIGMLWQTSTISPAHEHFLSINVKQKIILSTALLDVSKNYKSQKVIVLYLPEQELHDIGLLFLNFRLRAKGYYTIYLGESIPMESLKDLIVFFEEITFVTYFTVYPETDDILRYINSFYNMLLKHNNANLCVLGKKLAEVDLSKIPNKVSTYTSIGNFDENFH